LQVKQNFQGFETKGSIRFQKSDQRKAIIEEISEKDKLFAKYSPKIKEKALS